MPVGWRVECRTECSGLSRWWWQRDNADYRSYDKGYWALPHAEMKMIVRCRDEVYRSDG